MIKLKMNYRQITLPAAIFLLLMITVTACRKVPERTGTSVEKLAGKWYVRVDNLPKRYAINTYNTAANTPDQFWLETAALRDLTVSATENIGVKGKVPVQLSAQTFSGTGLANTLTATLTNIPTFDILNGKVITNGTVGIKSRTPADSIYFEVKAKGKTFKVSGFHATGFIVDEP
ncbi:hypothetical protein EOD41_03285 [Mucilaginibacter limnophilus]|uniref:Lipid/polyisoprenoid-binding YceI-like domain-containing protein n=1 Tax=Mucilaginibacter limnophilus TaxID=1932778 RepID=A0A3S2VAQ2_9SPHI|nr:lipid-binding protein [Mucilaginibacter limnophilus]RVU02971.1 hypothetical protein EOD41_03285 [Mucilaginibacter limnophilus]